MGGFASGGLFTVAAMLVVASGLHASGGIDLLVNKLLGRPGTARAAMVRLFLPVLPLSAFLNNTPVVAPDLNKCKKDTTARPSSSKAPLR